MEVYDIEEYARVNNAVFHFFSELRSDHVYFVKSSNAS